MKRYLVCIVLVVALAGCGLFDRGESTLTPEQTALLRQQTGQDVTMQNVKALADLEARLGAKIVGLEAKLGGGTRITTAAPAEEAGDAFQKGYQQGAELGAAIAPGAGWPTSLASIFGGLVVGIAGAAGVLTRRKAGGISKSVAPTKGR